MQIRNRVASLSYRVVSLVLLIIAFVSVMNVPTNSWELMLRAGILTCLLEIVIFSSEIVCNAIDLRRGVAGLPAGIYMPFRLIVTSYSTMSFLLFFITTFGFDKAEPQANTILFHLALLLLSVFDWLLFCEKGTVKWYSSFTGLFFPLMYALFLYFRTLIWSNAYFSNGGKYPYNILNQDYGMIALSAFLLIVCTGSIIFIYILINNILGGKYRKRQSYIE